MGEVWFLLALMVYSVGFALVIRRASQRQSRGRGKVTL